MKQFNKLKTEYESICASDQLKERVERIMKKENGKRNVFKSTLTLVASVVVAAVLVVNFVPGLAHAMEISPALASIVRVITFGRYEKADHGYSAKIITPKIEGLLDREFEQRLNDEFKENANAIILAYEQDVKELKEEFGDETVHMGVEYDYIIKTDNDDILAIDVYILNVAASSSTKHSFYNLDKKTGELLTLQGLFSEDLDYINVLSDYIREEMIRLNQEEDGMYWINGEDTPFDGFKQINSDQNFYINSDGNLVICFDKYDVAAGAQGSPEFIIPKDITDVISKK